MPSSYAHYRFGTQVIDLMPADVRGPILRHRALFDMGLHGPDILFFHSLIKPTPLFRLGSAYHALSGQDFFTQACIRFRKAPSEAAFAYLHGVLAHYCLDSVCHPFVYDMTDDTDLGHAELETEFDRYLLQLDGIKKPREYNTGRHMKLSGEDCSVVAEFYPEASLKDVSLCIRNIAWAQRLLSIPTAAGHKAVLTFTRFAGGSTSGQAMMLTPNPKCDHLNGKLLALYNQGIRKFPDLLEQLNHHLAYGEPFGDAFSANFDRG